MRHLQGPFYPAGSSVLAVGEVERSFGAEVHQLLECPRFQAHSSARIKEATQGDHHCWIQPMVASDCIFITNLLSLAEI